MKTTLILFTLSAAMAVAGTNAAPSTATNAPVRYETDRILVSIALERQKITTRLASLRQQNDDAYYLDARRVKSGEINDRQRTTARAERNTVIYDLEKQLAALDLKEIDHRRNNKLPMPDRLK